MKIHEMIKEGKKWKQGQDVTKELFPNAPKKETIQGAVQFLMAAGYVFAQNYGIGPGAMVHPEVGDVVLVTE